VVRVYASRNLLLLSARNECTKIVSLRIALPIATEAPEGEQNRIFALMALRNSALSVMSEPRRKPADAKS